MGASLRGGTLVAALLGLLLVGAAGLACTPVRRHAVLSAIFDGVPPYLSPEERARRQAEAAARAAEEAALLAVQRESGTVEKLSRFTHGPYAAKECGRCHDLGAASGFRGPGGGGAQSATATEDLAEGGRLRMPPSELCLSCHQDFSRSDPSNEGLWLHGPVGSGWCVLCHQAHSSFLPRLIRRDPPARLCISCHSRADLLADTAEHRPRSDEAAFPPHPPAGEADDLLRVVADCTRCHDPHRGVDRLLLRERSARTHQAGDPAARAAVSSP